MADRSWKRWAPLALGLGLVGLILAAGIALVTRRFDTYVQSSLAVAALGFALAILMSPGTLQTWLSGRQARYGGNTAIMILACLGIVVILNYLAYKNPVRWDLTEEQSNTLAPETVEAIRQLPEPVTAVGFYSSNFASSQAQARQLLDRYKLEAGGKLSYEFYDPIGDPVKAREYGITRDGTLVLIMGAQREELSFASEQELTGALIRFAHPQQRVLYFLTGHGERGLDTTDDTGLSKVADLLKKQNYEMRPLNLQVTTTVPSDARALVIAGPLVPVTADEVGVIAEYMQRPGAALVALMDPPVQMRSEAGTPDPLADYLFQAWGLNLPPDVVIDFYNSYPGQPLFPLNDGYEFSPITQKLQGISTVFPVARSVAVSGTAETFPGLTYTPLVMADARAWGEMDMASLDAQAGPALDAGDNPGPVALAVSVENSQTQARLVVFGDSDFASNGVADQGVNAQLFAGSVNWATTEESLISLTPKIPTTRTLVLTDVLTINVIFLVTVIVMPLLVLVLGGVVWFMRRRHV